MSNKKNKNTQEQLIKAQIEKQHREKTLIFQYKSKMRPFVDFLKKKKLTFNHARVGNSRVEYFRLDEFEKLLSANAIELQNNDNFKLIVRQVREELIYFKRPAHLKAKYPEQLQPVSSNSSEKKFACFRFDTTDSKKWMMYGIILLVLSMVLFPIWPFQLKYGIWLISFYLLIFLVGLIVIRLAIFVVCVMFGYNVWIFPNLFGEQGFIDSFRPIFYYEKWERNLYNTLIRVCVISSLVAYGCYLYLNPNTLTENIKFTRQTAQDIHDWGVEKIKNEKNFSERAITNLEHILKETGESQGSEQSIFNETLDVQL